MKNYLLFPWIFRPLGFLLTPFFYWAIETDVQLSFLDRTPVNTHMSDGHDLLSIRSENASVDVWMLGLVLSLLFVAFARLKQEDEYTAHLRLRALMQSVYINFCLAVALIFFTHGLQFLFIAAMHSLALLIVFSGLFYGRILLRRSFARPDTT